MLELWLWTIDLILHVTLSIQSEEPAPEERRLQYISGWAGAGTAAVSEGGAALWVSGSDVRRALAIVSCAWLVIDENDPSQPNIAEWIAVWPEIPQNYDTLIFNIDTSILKKHHEG